MTTSSNGDQRSVQVEDTDALRGFEHPRGTLALVIIVFLLFTAGWFGMYFLMFLHRGTMRP